MSTLPSEKYHQKRTKRNLFQKSKCHFFKKKKRFRKIGTRSKWDWPVRLRMRSRKTGTFFFLKKGHSLFWNAFPSVLFYEHFSLGYALNFLEHTYRLDRKILDHLDMCSVWICFSSSTMCGIFKHIHMNSFFKQKLFNLTCLENKQL